MTSTTRSMTARDFLDYLLGRDETHDLALQLAYVYDQRRLRRARPALLDVRSVHAG